MSYSSESATYSRSSRGSRSSIRRKRRGNISKFTKTFSNVKEITIFNLADTNKSNDKFNMKRYTEFLEFYKNINSNLDSEIKNETGDIIQSFPVKKEYIDILKNIENEYKIMYITPIIQDNHEKYKQYPNFLKDLYLKSYKVYEKYEKQLELPKRIEKQTDEEIFKTLELRINGLQKCKTYKEANINEDDKKYYTTEYTRELTKYNDLQHNTKINISQKIEEQCKNIFYNSDALNKYENINYNIDYNIDLIKKFFSNPNEILYAKTFLPVNCIKIIDGKYEIDYAELEILLKSGDRNYRQFIFGFYSDSILENVRKIKPFLFEAGGMSYMENYNDNCNQLVNWSLFLNMLYCRCSISNTVPLCPVRFIMPLDTVPIKIEKNIITNNTTITFQMRDKLPLDNLFDGDAETNAEFIGIIAMKYYHEETHKIRIWYLFVFKNNDLTKTDRQNTITGIRDNIILCNYRLRQINMFALFEKHNITHYELLHYISLSKQSDNRKIYFYKPTFFSLKDNKTIFISKKSDLESNSILKDLQLVKATITMTDIPGNYHIIPKTNICISYNTLLANTGIELSNTGTELANTGIELGNTGTELANTGIELGNTGHKMPLYFVGGNNLQMPITIKTTSNEIQLYFSNLVLSKYYLEFLNSLEIVERLGWYNDNPTINYILPNREKIYKYLKHTYLYLLVDERDSFFKHKKHNNKLNIKTSRNITITKYKPISLDFYRVTELFQKYKLFDILDKHNNTNNVLTIGSSLSLFEYICYTKYNFTSITNILTLQQNYYANLIDEWDKLINNVSSIYKVNNINYNDSIYNISESNIINNISKNNKIVFWSVDIVLNGVSKYSSYYNIPNYISGILFSLQHLAKSGTLIYNIESVAYKHNADIILIISQFFEKWDLFYSELHNRYKRSGTTAIFTNFKGISEQDIQYLKALLVKVKNIYPDEAKHFNIYNQELRKQLHIYKKTTQLQQSSILNIIELLNYDINDKIYEPFRSFNDSRYMEQIIYITKMINILSSPNVDGYLHTKTPTPDQITSSILYCKKYDIPYFDKYNNTKMEFFISKNILYEMYGIQEPILYNFKTPFKTYITDKIILNPKFNAIKSSKSQSSQSSITILKAVHSNISKNKKRKSSKTTKALSSLSRRDTIGAIFRDMFSQSNNKIKSKSNKSKTIKSNYSKTRKSTLKRTNISLLNPIFPSNNQLVQVGRLIDSRRDFTKPEKKPGAKYDPQTVLYDQLKDQFRYYKGKGQGRNVPNLTNIVQERLGDRSISQAWLKMYEIITDCELVPNTPHSSQKGTFRSFHICEAPGTFINALNNYIRTKTQYTNFEWHSQSLNPKVAIINDQFRLIERHPDRWDWGADGTGDITQVANIKHYKQKVAERAERAEQAHATIQLMTSDCGLEWGNPMYEFVAFSSYVAILNILPRGGTMIYKILSPIDLPLIWNLIYITFTNFKEMFFFKPIQNAQSREFYIVAKDYLGTDQQVLDKLMEIIAKWGKLENAATPYKAKWVEELDLFGDVYPVEFVAQVINISERLAQNYVNSIERIIYYVDNIDILGDEYKKHIEKYIQEKNEDWIRKYRPRKLEHKWIL